jgi:hypothetical protein
MKNIRLKFILALCCFLPLAVPAQIRKVQYWFDTDFAGKTEQSVTSGNMQELTELNTAGLSEGLHTVHIRAKDTENWSVVHSQLFYKLPENVQSAAVVAYEYWVDTDFAGKRQETLSGQLATVNELDFNLLGEGLHLLHIRALDNLGRYSPVYSRLFYKPDETIAGNKIDAYRYWYDYQFDEHVFAVLEATANPYELDERYTLPDTFTEGEEHTFHIQFRDALGNWSTIVSDTFKIVSSSGGVGIDVTTANSVVMYPNPAKEGFFLKGITDSNARIAVIDMTGKKVFEQPVCNDDYIPVQALPSGVYTVKLFLRNQAIERKIIKKNE